MSAVQRLPTRRAGQISWRWREASVAARLRWSAWAAVAVLVLLYLISWVGHLHSTIDALLWNSDYAGGFTLSETLAHFGSGGNTVISTTGAWADLWFGLLTADLPFHRQLWEIAPTLLFIVSTLTIGFGVGRLAGRSAGLIAAAIVFVASPFALAVLMAPVAHNTVYPSTAIIGVLLPWALTRQWSSRVHWMAAIVFGAAVLGIDIASDKLLLITAVIPAGVLALALVVRRSQRNAAIGVLATILLSAPAAVATNAIMKAEGYAITAPKLQRAPLSTIGFHFRLLWQALRNLAGGYLEAGHPGTLHPVLGVACTVVLSVGLAGLAWAGALAVVALVRRQPAEDARWDAHIHVAYWFVSAIAVVATFVGSTAVGDGFGHHESYILTIVFSIAATVPFAAVRVSPLRWAAPFAVGLFAVASIVGSQESYNNAYRVPLSNVAGEIVQLARANHATRGFAGYWDASNLTWYEKGAITVRPLLQCANPNPNGSNICPFLLMRTSTWYRPQPGRSFLIVDPSNLFVTSLPDNLGPPLSSYALGPVTMYVYPYDIASKLGPYPVWPY